MDGLSYHQKAFPNLVNNYELIISFFLVPIETFFGYILSVLLFFLSIFAAFHIDYLPSTLYTQTKQN